MFVSNGGRSALCKTAAALTLTAVIVSPLRVLDPEFSGFALREYSSMSRAAELAEQQGRALQSSAAASKIAEYVQSRAARDGIDIKVKIDAYADSENKFTIRGAQITYADNNSYNKNQTVRKILLDDCGIAEDDQLHLHAQEDSSGKDGKSNGK